MSDFALTIIYLQLIIGGLGALVLGAQRLYYLIRERRYAKYQREWFADNPGAEWNDFAAHNRGKL